MNELIGNGERKIVLHQSSKWERYIQLVFKILVLHGLEHQPQALVGNI